MLTATERKGLWLPHILLFALVALVLASCSPPRAPAASSAAPAAAAPGDLIYRLSNGDKLQVDVYDEPDLSAVVEITGTGKVNLPLIGPVEAEGKTVDEFQQAVTEKLLDGYLTAPRVNVQVLNYKPFYIFGEVSKPGEYTFKEGMNVINAVAIAGGYTYRANSTEIYIQREGGAEYAYPVGPNVRVLPGDLLRVPERYF